MSDDQFTGQSCISDVLSKSSVWLSPLPDYLLNGALPLFSLGDHIHSCVFLYHIHSSNSQTSISPPNSTILSANHQLDISPGLFHEISESSYYLFFSNLLLFLCSLSQITGPSSVKGSSQKVRQ